MNAAYTRVITLSRENTVFRLHFNYDPDLVSMVKTLPFAVFDPKSRSWTSQVCAQTVDKLREYFHRGLLDVSPDDLLDKGEKPEPVAEAVLRTGSKRKPYFVHFATRSSPKFPAFRGILGAEWEKAAGCLSYPASSAAALAELVAKGALSDPENLLTATEKGGVTVFFDGRTGVLKLQGDPRAAAVFKDTFPKRDIVQLWREKGLDVEFLDDYTEEIYAGELARVGPGYQPEGLLIDLMQYQKQSVALALTRRGLGVFSAPGLGKSAIGISVGLELLNQNKITRVVAVVPAAVRTQWAREIVKFTGTDEDNIVVIDGDKQERYDAYDEGMNAQWVVVHYDILARDEKELTKLFNGALVVADEAHRVKNHRAARTKALRNLTAGSARRLALTGTPVETAPSEWFEVLSGFAVPGCLGSPYEFNERYRWKAPHGGYEGVRNPTELKLRSKPFYIRHTKAQVATHLPPLQVSQMILDPSPAYKAALQRAHVSAVEEIKAVRIAALGDKKNKPDELELLDDQDVEKATAGAHLTAVGQLRLLCSSPRLISEDSTSGAALIEAGIIPDEDGPKLDELRNICAELAAIQTQRINDMRENNQTTTTPNEVAGERVVIFTFSKRMANLIKERFDEDGISNVIYTGDTKTADRDAAVTKFTDENSDVIAFIATDAAAEGLNLGRCCNWLINVDLTWSPSKLQQRSNRIHRLDGTANHYQVTNMIVAGTMEAGVLKLLEQRAEMSDALLGEAGGKANTVGAKRQMMRASDIMRTALEDMNLNITKTKKPKIKTKAVEKDEPLPEAQEEKPVKKTTVKKITQPKNAAKAVSKTSATQQTRARKTQPVQVQEPVVYWDQEPPPDEFEILPPDPQESGQYTLM